MHLIRLSLYVFLVCSTVQVCQAQQADGITVLVKPKKDGVWIRYAPNTPYVWQLGNKYGYVIERFLLGKDGILAQTTGKKLLTAPVRPVSEAEFEKLARTEPRASIVAEMIYSPEFSQEPQSGSPASILKENREQQNRLGLALFACDLSRSIAIAAGLMTIDKTALSGSRYIYRVSLAQVPKDVKIEPGVAVVDILPEKSLFPPERLILDFQDKRVTLSWFIKLHRGIYSAYLIEKSTDGKNFKTIDDLPYAYMTDIANPETAYFTDSLANNEQTFYYRIKGISPFGEISPSSAILSGKGKEDVSGLAVIEKASVEKNKLISLQWRFPEVYHKDIKGYIIAKAPTAGGPYQDLFAVPLPPGKLTYTDANAGLNNYYLVRVIDKQGKEKTRSFPFLAQLEDNVPPAVPVNLSGKIDASGIVALTWKANSDKDLRGYRIFRANSTAEEFVEVTRQILTQTNFRDTINLQTLTKQIFYKVIAVDNYYNTSDYSPALALNRPDKVAPSPPAFVKVIIEKETIVLEWQNSISEDVAGYELYQQVKDSLPVKISSWPATENKNSFTAKSMVLGKTYRYILQALDSTGNIGKAVSGTIVFETGIRKAVESIKAVADRTNKKIVLTWTYPQTGVVRCVIYRAKGSQEVNLYETLSGNPGRFEDKDLTANNLYKYRIKLYFSKGIQTELSQVVSLEY
ncbi:MAG: fibronectin type III domain-containing protein [Verrucomicrobia bacterium]|nr:fibronectin type III domain-containing protein [Cytophagales bacterium]